MKRGRVITRLLRAPKDGKTPLLRLYCVVVAVPPADVRSASLTLSAHPEPFTQFFIVF